MEKRSNRYKRLLRDALRLRGQLDSIEPTKYESLRSCIEKRLDKLVQKVWNNKDAKRLVKYRASLFVFLYHREVPLNNNFSER
ncbi:MAG: hypothetical protein LBU34_16745 [Planctomycetaceae bacterium]|nr:hypothetical protein [Planctomycetaceae bacterium]